jgi:hypothetical protein
VRRTVVTDLARIKNHGFMEVSAPTDPIYGLLAYAENPPGQNSSGPVGTGDIAGPILVFVLLGVLGAIGVALLGSSQH